MKKQSGSGLIFAVVLLFVILGMVVTLSSITVLETKMNQKTKSSVGAFYNSESGVEWALNKIATSPSDTIQGTFSSQISGNTVNCPSSFAGCTLYLLGSDGNVLTADKFSVADSVNLIKSVRSVGTQSVGGTADSQRAIEAAVAAPGDFQVSCASNAGAVIVCCQVNTNTGATECKTAIDGTAGWAVFPKPGITGLHGISNNPWP